MKDDAISRQRVLKLLSTIPPEEAMTKARNRGVLYRYYYGGGVRCCRGACN